MFAWGKLSDPSTQELVLTGQNIADLAPLQAKLASMPLLKSLNLEGNNLTNLPADLSNLRSLQTLNLKNNKISSVENLIPALKTLPALIELEVDISSDAEEDALLIALPAITCLNGVNLTEFGRPSIGQSPGQMDLRLEESWGFEEKNSFDLPDEIALTSTSEVEARPRLPEVSLTKVR